MPRIRQYEERDAMKDLTAEINAQCGRYGYRTQKSLGSAIGVCQSTAGKYLQRPEMIPLSVLRSLVKSLRLDPIVVLRAVGFSTKDIKQSLDRFAPQ